VKKLWKTTAGFMRKKKIQPRVHSVFMRVSRKQASSYVVGALATRWLVCYNS
jgi:hypothetical protein